jgi:diacylglycerol kinase (ATP)
VDRGSSSGWVVVNPAAGRGECRRIMNRLRDSFAGYSVLETTKPGEESALAGHAMDSGAQVLVCVGGDGTCGRIANAIMKAQSSCALAVVPSGTGNDFAKTLGVEKYGPERIAGLIAQEQLTRIDLGQADDHYFLNSCGFGFDPSVLEASNQIRFLKGNAVYIYAALKQLFSYRGVDVAASGAPSVTRGSMLMVTVSNGRSLGGAFKIAPHASVLDGKLDACFFRDTNVIERVKLFAGALRGTHLQMPSVTSASVQQLTLSFANNPSIEMDGELRVARSRTVELRCVPRALGVIAAPGALV